MRQPLFANGGAGIAVTRAAMRAVLPHLAKCEAEYKWNWPGDIRVAQCFVDAGVKLEWVHNFHSENPHVIIEKAKPPPGSVPVGLTLPPLSFHHVDVRSHAHAHALAHARAHVQHVHAHAHARAHARAHVQHVHAHAHVVCMCMCIVRMCACAYVCVDA